MYEVKSLDDFKEDEYNENQKVNINKKREEKLKLNQNDRV